MVAALLDTSVLVAVNKPGETAPDLSMFDELFVSSLCYSELRMGLATISGEARQRRQDRLDDIVDLFREGIPYDDRAALEYGRIVRKAVAAGSSAQSNTLDRMIAGVARANDMALVTRNFNDLKNIRDLLNIVEV